MRTKAKGRHGVVCRLNCVIHVSAPWGRDTCHLGRYINPRRPTFTFYFLLTSCSVYWTLQRVWSLAHTSSTMHGLSHLLHEELHWLDVPERIHYKLEVTLHRCLQYNAHLVDCCTPVSKTFPADVIYGQPLHITWLYHVTGSALSVVRPSLSLVRQSGTRYLTVSVTRRSAATASDNRWTRIYFVVTTQQSAHTAQ